MAFRSVSRQSHVDTNGAVMIPSRISQSCRGYVRVATTANCGLPAEQYDVALVDWRGRSIKALDATLDWFLDFLTPARGLVVWLDPQEPAANRKLRRWPMRSTHSGNEGRRARVSFAGPPTRSARR